MERIFTPQEVAEYLRIPLSTVRKYLREGRLRGVKIGKHWRVRERDVEALLDPLGAALRAAPEDDEPLDEGEEAALREAREAIAQGRTRPWEDVKRSLPE